MADELRVLAGTKYLQLVQRGSWVYAHRPNLTGVVVILAVTPEQNVIFVEQFRPPLDSRVVELPAGLAGDEEGAPNERLAAAAERELQEETGYTAGSLQRLFTGPSSAGLTDERVTFFLARDLVRMGAGGGVAGENITVHEVPLSSVREWLAAKLQAGVQISPRIFAALYFLQYADFYQEAD